MRFAILALALVACEPKPVLIPSHDSGVVSWDGADPCSLACSHLSAMGCAEGNHPRCVEACAQDQAAGMGAQLDPACVIAAQSVAALHACNARCR